MECSKRAPESEGLTSQSPDSWSQGPLPGRDTVSVRARWGMLMQGTHSGPQQGRLDLALHWCWARGPFDPTSREGNRLRQEHPGKAFTGTSNEEEDAALTGSQAGPQMKEGRWFRWSLQGGHGDWPRGAQLRHSTSAQDTMSTRSRARTETCVPRADLGRGGTHQASWGQLSGHEPRPQVHLSFVPRLAPGSPSGRKKGWAGSGPAHRTGILPFDVSPFEDAGFHFTVFLPPRTWGKRNRSSPSALGTGLMVPLSPVALLLDMRHLLDTNQVPLR